MLTSVLLAALANGAAADPPEWEYLGLEGVVCQSITADSTHGRIFATTIEGFLYRDIPGGMWISRDDVGWIGRDCRSLATHRGQPQRVITGRTDAFFKGYIEVSEDLGLTYETVYNADGGTVMDIQNDPEVDDLYFACTWHDISPGELLRSTDGGLGWELLTGYLHYTMTSLDIDGEGYVYVGGDALVTASYDGGATWQSLAANLPPGLGIYCVAAGYYLAGLPDKRHDLPAADFLLAGNDSGLYLTETAELDWQLILPGACRAVDVFYNGDLMVIGAITFDGRVMVNAGPGGWQDWTGNIAPATPMDLAGLDGIFYVVTSDAGVFRTPLPTTSEVPPGPAAPGLTLTACPNPFNPVTTLRFTSSRGGPARLAIYDAAGRLQATLVDEWLDAGSHEVTWQPRRAASGVYFGRLQIGPEITTTLLVLVK